MNSKQAFSLIELMVVIAIIGVLAAIAGSLYSRYIIVSRVSSAVTLINSIVEDSITYAAQHGKFPNAYELGLSTIVDSTNVDNASNLNQYLVTSYINDSGSCGAYGYVALYLDPGLLGLDSSVNTFVLECDPIHLNNTVAISCSYAYGESGAPNTYGPPGISKTDNIFPGWINQNVTTGWDAINWATPGLALSATCQ